MKTLLAAIIMVLVVVPAAALREGIGGYSGKGGDSCSDQCHAGGAIPEVELSGPLGAATDSTLNLEIRVRSTNPRQFVAGFDVASEAGALEPVAGEGVRSEGAELTHVAPKQAIDDVTTWLFRWHAPSAEGVYRIFGSGLSANGTGSRLGDESATDIIEIFVRAAQHFGDANCDQRRSAADTASLIARLGATASPGCTDADADGNGTISRTDLELVTASLFGG